MSKPTDGIVRCRRCLRQMIAEEVKGHDCSKLTITGRKTVDCADVFFSKTEQGTTIHIVDFTGMWYRFRLPDEVARELKLPKRH